MSFKTIFRHSALAALLIASVQAHAQTALISTSEGDITVELNAKAAPITVKNFVTTAQEGYYTGTIFHRVIDNFMIQGGGFTADMQEKTKRPSIINEADNGLKNDRYTIAMARTMEPHSASSQFFINTKDNDFLNHSAKSMQGWGYAVFGKVTKGFDVVNKISKSYTKTVGPYADVPIKPIVIKSVTITP
ncbi:peptidylprolyl isomerase [Hydromonas duriensis]|uniref:Peptidyl-prolyl cis-trans isomerase n=1 Tax=Hydromonas duriensis TaxID=1527608 RepID=A0A4R6Y828_9BURK|nr:peptidylprolyl isomerase [Hydromonas duriensis]TDR31528.1 peptidyl-prolyl cis-trans isomerase B (cyclophilin B) [Hydromonas duriensis]